MAKLTFKISNDDENNDKRNQNNQQNSLSTKKNTDEQTFDNTNQQVDNQKIENNNLSNLDSEKYSENEKLIFIDDFCNTLGCNSFNEINNEKLFQILNQQLPKNETIVNLLNELINDSFIAKFKSLSLQQNTQNQILSENNLNQEKLLSQINELKTKIELLEEEKYRNDKKYSSTISIEELVKEMILNYLPSELKEIAENLLKEAYINGDKDSKLFVIYFLRGFQFVVEAIKNIQEDEKQNLETLYKATNMMLKTIQGTIAAERRPLLEILATLCNKYLSTYKFLSPEQSLQIDTQIHNAQGKGGTMVKEGLSMVVIRTDTGKTVYYAEINTK